MEKDNFWAHIHLVVNDIPILGFFFAAIFLIASLVTKERKAWAQAGMLTIAITFIGMLLAFFSGKPALDVIEGQPRTSMLALKQHHVWGFLAIAFAMVTVILAIVGIVKARKAGGVYSRKILIGTLISLMLTIGAFAWMGQAGGRINHYELQNPADRKSGPAGPH